MIRRAAFAILVFCVVGVAASGKERWELKFSPKRFDTYLYQGSVVSKLDGLYLYMVVDIENTSNTDVPLDLGVKVETDAKGKTYFNRKFTVVEKPLAKRLRLKDYLNASEMRETTLGAGEKVTCLMIFGKVSALADKLDVVVGGLKSQVSLKKGKRTLIDEDLILQYRRPGDEFRRQLDKIKLAKRMWVVRSRRDAPYK